MITMVTDISSPVKDKDYNLICAIEASLSNVWTLETYIQDAREQGDDELADWFRRIRRTTALPANRARRCSSSVSNDGSTAYCEGGRAWQSAIRAETTTTAHSLSPAARSPGLSTASNVR